MSIFHTKLFRVGASVYKAISDPASHRTRDKNSYMLPAVTHRFHPIFSDSKVTRCDLFGSTMLKETDPHAGNGPRL